MAKQGDDGIVWTGETVNITRGCSLESDGCKNCYAMAMAGRFSGSGLPYEGLVIKTTQGYKWTGKLLLVPAMLSDLLRKTKPRTIFIDSMSDLFHDAVPESYIDKFFAVAALTQQNTYQLLTKRAERARDYLQRLQARAVEVTSGLLEDADVYPFPKGSLQWREASYKIELAIADGPLKNVHMGVSAENQAMAKRRVAALVEAPAAIRWISIEPMLGPIDLTPWLQRQCDGMPVIHWVVVGGESGPNSRPMHPAWPRALEEQCAGAKVAFLFKQWGSWVGGTGSKSGWIYLQNGAHTCGDKNTHEWGDGTISQNVGKKVAGRMLDGVQHDGYPLELQPAVHVSA